MASFHTISDVGAMAQLIVRQRLVVPRLRLAHAGQGVLLKLAGVKECKRGDLNTSCEQSGPSCCDTLLGEEVLQTGKV